MLKALATAALLALPMSASAATYLLTATSQVGAFDDFTIVFNDSNEDFLLEFDEIVEFSGVDRNNVTYNGVFSVPEIIVTSSPLSVALSNGPWRFTDPDPSTAQNPRNGSIAAWTYDIAVIPLPASALLLIGALGALGLASGRRAAA